MASPPYILKVEEIEQVEGDEAHVDEEEEKPTPPIQWTSSTVYVQCSLQFNPTDHEMVHEYPEPTICSPFDE